MRILTDIWAKSAKIDGWLVAGLCSCRITCISSRRITIATGVPAPIWQADTFDHILRSAEWYAEKWAYVVANPVRAGLVREGETWPWQGEIFSLRCE